MTQNVPQRDYPERDQPNTPDYFRANPPDPRHVIIAKRAGGLMIGLGVIVALLGGCVLLGSAMPINQLPPDPQQKIRQFEAESHITLHALFLSTAAVLAAIALFQIITGVFVWRSGKRGGKAPIVIAIVATSLLATLWVLQLLAALATGNAPNVAAGAGILLISLCLMAWQLAWLIQALHAVRSAPRNASLYADTPLTIPSHPPARFVYPPLPPEAGPIGWPYPPPPPPSIKPDVA